MKQILAALLMLSMLVLIPAATAIGTGVSVGISVTPTSNAPEVYLDPATRLYDTNGLLPRNQNYAFAGEFIVWQVLVRDKDGDIDVTEVAGTMGLTQGTGNPIEVNCAEDGDTIADGTPVAWAPSMSPNTYNSATDSIYTCTLTIEPQWNGEYFLTVEAQDARGMAGIMQENEFWFMNPTLQLLVSEPPVFPPTAPGSIGYSNTIVVTNNAQAGSGVELEMRISGTDFYDSSSGTSVICPTTNQLALTNFRYYATQGAFDTNGNGGIDAEGYDTIPYGDSVQTADLIIDGAPLLASGGDIAVTFKLDLPSPCIGNFDSGDFYFWGQVV